MKGEDVTGTLGLLVELWFFSVRPNTCSSTCYCLLFSLYFRIYIYLLELLSSNNEKICVLNIYALAALVSDGGSRLVWWIGPWLGQGFCKNMISIIIVNTSVFMWRKHGIKCFHMSQHVAYDLQIQPWSHQMNVGLWLLSIGKQDVVFPTVHISDNAHKENTEQQVQSKSIKMKFFLWQCFIFSMFGYLAFIMMFFYEADFHWLGLLEPKKRNRQGHTAAYVL